MSPSHEINEWLLQTRGWRWFEEKDPEKWETSAFVDPEGRWFNVPFADHFRFAEYVIADLKHLTTDERLHLDLNAVSDEVVKMGWLLIHSEPMTGINVYGSDHMTMKQYRALKKHFGNMRLFRGWTIDMLWKDANKAKAD